MKNIFIDPVIVTTSPEDASREDVEAWLENLQVWLKEALSSHYGWLHFVQATNLLVENGRFPSFDVLRTWQRKYRLDINPGIIVRDVNTFFRDEKFDLQGNLEQIGYLVETKEGSIVIHPEPFTARWLECIQDVTKQILVTTCACKYTMHPFAEELHIVTLRLPDDVREIEVSAIIMDALPNFERDASNKITQTFSLLFIPDHLLPLIDVQALWLQGDAGITYAIEQQFKKDWQQSLCQPMKFRFGPQFVESVNNAGLDTNEVVLTKIVRIAAAIIADKAMDVNLQSAPTS